MVAILGAPSDCRGAIQMVCHHPVTPLPWQVFWMLSLGMSLSTWMAGRSLSQGQQGVSAVLAVFAQLFMTQAGVVYAASCERGAHDKNKARFDVTE